MPVAIAIPLAQAVAQSIASNPAVVGLAVVTVGYAIDQIQRGASEINIDVSGVGEALDYLQNSRAKAYQAGIALKRGFQEERIYRYEDHPLSPRRGGITPRDLAPFPKDRWDSASPNIPPFPGEPNLDTSFKPHGNPNVDTKLPPFPNTPDDEFRYRPQPGRELPPLQVLEFKLGLSAQKGQVVPAKDLRNKAKSKEGAMGLAVSAILARQLIVAPSASTALALSPNNSPIDPKRLFPLLLDFPIPELQRESEEEFSRRPSMTPTGFREVPILPHPDFPNMPTNPNKEYEARIYFEYILPGQQNVSNWSAFFLYSPANPPTYFEGIILNSPTVTLKNSEGSIIAGLTLPPGSQLLQVSITPAQPTTEEDYPTSYSEPVPQLGNPELLFPSNTSLPNFEQFDLFDKPNLNPSRSNSNSSESDFFFTPSSLSNQLLQNGFVLSPFSQTPTSPTTSTPSLPVTSPIPQTPTSPNLQLPQLLPPERSIPTDPVLSTTGTPPGSTTTITPTSNLDPLDRNNLSRIGQAIKHQLSCKRMKKPDDCPSIGDIWDKLTGENNGVNNSGINFESISISYKICDNEGKHKTQTELVQIPANSTGSLEAFTKALFKAISSLHDCPNDAILALPEWYQAKPGGACPQAAVLLADEAKKSFWPFHIPHYNKPKSFKPVLPSFIKGNFYGKLKLKDNSRVLIYAKNRAEAEKMINAIIPLINPAQLTNPPEITYGEKQGPKKLAEKTVKAIRILYYSKGLQNTKPDWVVYLDD